MTPCHSRATCLITQLCRAARGGRALGCVVRSGALNERSGVLADTTACFTRALQ